MQPTTEKPCSDCDRVHDHHQLICPCGEVLETRHYLLWIGITSALALGLVRTLSAVGALEAFSIREVFVMEAALLVVAYPAVQFLQGRRDPQRPVAAEMGSVFSGRYDRCIVIAVMLFVPLVWLAPEAAGEDIIAPGYRAIRLGWLYTATALWFVAVAAMVRDQGLAFFDLRVRNTYVKQGRERAHL